MSVVDTSVKRPIGTIMFYIGLIVLGAVSLYKLSINLLPDLSYPKLTVLTQYPGSGPEEIEKFITTKLEGPLSSVPSVKKINSVSKEGNSIITIEFHWGTDMDFALLHTKEKTEEVRSFLPDDCDSPSILEWDPSSSPIIIAILKSNKRNLKSLKETAEFMITPRLEQLEGVSKAEIRGGDDEEVSVEINPEKANNLGITLTEVANAIKSNNIFEQGGMVRKDKLRYILKIEGEIDKPEEIDDIVVKQVEGRNILVKDIGRAFYKNKVKQGDIRFNSDTAIALLIYRESGGNTVNATKDVQKAFESMEKEFKDINFFVISKEADLIISSINSLKQSLILGGFLSIFILLLFLQNFRDPILVSTVIPISIISTFVLMFFFKVNINIMSLGGLVLGVGMFVDNSIIVLESIFRHRDKNNLVDSIIKGTKEVAGAISASTLTTISIFLPVIYLYGITGKLFRDQAMTVAFSLISSLVVAITLLPALSAFRMGMDVNLEDLVLGKTYKKRWFSTPLNFINMLVLIFFKIPGYIILYIIGTIYFVIRFIIRGIGKISNIILQPLFRGFNKLYSWFDEVYHKILIKILNKKIIAVYLVILVLAGIIGTYFMLHKELLPAPDSNKFDVSASTIPAYGFVETNNIASRIQQKINGLKNVDFVFTEAGAVSNFAGRSEDLSVNSIHFIVSCSSKEVRNGVMSKVEEILKEEELEKFTMALEKNTLSQYLSMEGDNFKLKVFYEFIDNGKLAVKNIMDVINKHGVVSELKSTITEGKPVYKIIFKQDLLNKLNITKAQVSDFINQAVSGKEAGSLKKVQKSFDILVRVPVTGIMEMRKLLSLPIPLNNNTYYLKDLVTIQEVPSIKELTREAQERYFMISGNVNNTDLGEFIKKLEPELDKLELPSNTRFVFSGEEAERRKAFDSLIQAIWLAVLLVYMIMAAKFENIMQPLIIMFTVPMGLVGAFLVLMVSGNSLNIISGIGILVLIGIGVNDAIVKVEYSNQMRLEGMGVREAILEASKVRLRPILMTTFTTIFGLVPMGLMSQTGSELQKPLALVVIGGLIFTTFLTLIFIPVFYEVLENLKEKRKAKTTVEV